MGNKFQVPSASECILRLTAIAEISDWKAHRLGSTGEPTKKHYDGRCYACTRYADSLIHYFKHDKSDLHEGVNCALSMIAAIKGDVKNKALAERTLSSINALIAHVNGRRGIVGELRPYSIETYFPKEKEKEKEPKKTEEPKSEKEPAPQEAVNSPTQAAPVTGGEKPVVTPIEPAALVIPIAMQQHHKELANAITKEMRKVAEPTDDL